MEALILLGLVFGCFYAILKATRWMCPWAADVLGWLCRSMHRLVVRWLWRVPTQWLGPGLTLWIFSLVLAVALSVTSVAVDGAAGLPCVLLLAIVVGCIWSLLRWWGQWRHQPHELPQRLRIRRRR